jgi:serine/threonine-protein kinase
MSPEQISGKELTEQSDLFSAGVVAYELVTGKNPFLGNDVGATLNNIFAKDVTLENEQCADTSVRQLINQLLLKKASERIPSAKAALAHLDAPATEQNSKGETENTAQRRRGTSISLISLLIIMSLVVFWMLNKGQNEQPVVRQENSPVDSVAVTSARDSLTEAAAQAPPQRSDKYIEQTAVQDDMQEPTASTVPGRLHINCLPWAHVWIDGDSVNTTPLSDALSLKPGDYEIRLEHPSYPAHVQNIRIEPEKDVYINATLYSYLLCNIYPWGDVYVDGESFGQTPFSEAAIITPGEHVLVIKNQQYGEVTRNIKTVAGDTLFFTYNFEQEAL